ncbi:hypothetical protein NL676_002605 [Syzygium grande]|nr:hypothetical protein NL676_002605 [Syzygium grande]
MKPRADAWRLQGPLRGGPTVEISPERRIGFKDSPPVLEQNHLLLSLSLSRSDNEEREEGLVSSGPGWAPTPTPPTPTVTRLDRHVSAARDDKDATRFHRIRQEPKQQHPAPTPTPKPGPHHPETATGGRTKEGRNPKETGQNIL